MNRKFHLFSMLYLLPLLVLSCTLQPTFDLADLSSDVLVTDEADYYKLEPASSPLLDTSIVFYPGGLVAAEAYLKMLALTAAEGYEIFVIKMPLDLAVFSPFAADDVIPLLSGDSWVIGGHSLGGAMAARYVNRGDSDPDGLILMAAYPGDSDSLIGETLPVISIFASEDGVATPEDIEESKSNLPAHTEYLEIPGGNHAQFGSYGEQSGDNEAGITEEEQHALIADGVLQFLEINL